jgi:hypothetical protein
MRTLTANNARTAVGLNKRQVARLLQRLNKTDSMDARVDQASKLFLNRPYVENPLGGGPRRKEVLRVSLDAFDCVTYMEAVLALAASRNANEFLQELRRLRYRSGNVLWFDRNHYMVDWLASNKTRGSIKDLTRGRDTVAKTRTLDVVHGLPPRRVTFRCFPKRRFARIKHRMQTGDLIMFVSTNKRLDVFHTGVLIQRDDRVLLRHATRSAGKVVEQSLRDFLMNHRMSGFILARPLCRP